MTTYTAALGDTVVIAKAGGRYEVRMNTEGGWESFRSDLHDVHEAYKVARGKLEARNGQEVWFRNESEPDSAIRPYRPS